jgi:hypothetical protein
LLERAAGHEFELIFRWSINVMDDDDVESVLHWLQLETELISYGFLKRRTQWLWLEIGAKRRSALRCPFDGKIICTSQLCCIDDWATEVAFSTEIFRYEFKAHIQSPGAYVPRVVSRHANNFIAKYWQALGNGAEVGLG